MEENEEEKKEGMLYWLKLEKDFFEHKEIKKLRQIEGGDTFTIIYLKMLLLSLSTEGKLFYDGYGDTFAEDLALAINEDEGKVDATISFLTQYGFVTKLSDDEYYMTAVMGMTGKKTEAAVRKEKSRKAQKEAMRDNVTTMSHDCPTASQNVTQRKIQDKDNREDTKDQIQDSRDKIKNKDIRPEQGIVPDLKSDLKDNKNSQIEENDSLSATEYIKSQIAEDDSDTKNMSDICSLVREIADISDSQSISSEVNKLILSTGYSINDVYRLINQKKDGLKELIDDCPSDPDDNRAMDTIILNISPHEPKEEKTDYIYEDTVSESGDGEVPF